MFANMHILVALATLADGYWGRLTHPVNCHNLIVHSAHDLIYWQSSYRHDSVQTETTWTACIWVLNWGMWREIVNLDNLGRTHTGRHKENMQTLLCRSPDTPDTIVAQCQPCSRSLYFLGGYNVSNNIWECTAVSLHFWRFMMRKAAVRVTAHR